MSVLTDEERISPNELSKVMQCQSACVVVDVRQPLEYEMCHISGSVNIPLPSITRSVNTIQQLVADKENPVLGESLKQVLYRSLKWCRGNVEIKVTKLASFCKKNFIAAGIAAIIYKICNI